MSNDSADGSGDINLNDIQYEISDAILFSRYFVYGFAVFTINIQRQVAATDINWDGAVLTIEDFVYLCRIIAGDAVPMPKPISVVPAVLQRNEDVISIDRFAAAGVIVAKGNVAPVLLASGIEMLYNYNGTNTRILVWGGVANLSNTFTGDFIKVSAPIESFEFATYEGFKVDAAYNCCWGKRGYANSDGRIEPNILDITALTSHVLGKETANCQVEADVNGDGSINIADVALLIDYLFHSGQAPANCS